jgi:hypothetical protein
MAVQPRRSQSTFNLYITLKVKHQIAHPYKKEKSYFCKFVIFWVGDGMVSLYRHFVLHSGDGTQTHA